MNKQQSLVNDLFKIMSVRKPMQIRSMYPTAAAIDRAKAEYVQQWQGLTPALVRHGIEKLRQQVPLKWLPDPIEFARNFCRMQPEDYGIPTVSAAWLEACEHSHEPSTWAWSHFTVQLTGRRLGWALLRGFSHQDDVRRNFEHIFQQQIKAFMDNPKGYDGQAHQIAIEDHNKLSEAEQSRRFHERQLYEQMQAQGIDLNQGREFYLERIRGLLKK